MNGHHHEGRARPIIIVTGANAGVGFAICHRLLVQLVHRIPPDSLPQRAVSRSIPISPSPLDKSSETALPEFAECESLTLILACRNTSKAEEARTQLLGYLDKEVERIKWKGKSVGGGDKDVKHAETFRENVRIIVHRLDLASIENIFKFARDIDSKYPYISHLVCNAGVASFIGYDWPLAIKQLLTDFIGAVVSPLFKIQRIGEMSEDGLGWIWQCNVFGHYVLFRLLEPLLERSYNDTRSPSRILWMSSLEALPECYDPSDWQLLRNSKSYEASKHQIDLLVGWFEQQQQIKQREERKALRVRHFLCHPGVVRTNIAVKSLNNNILDLCMQLAFFTAHFFGSHAHTITPYKSAISAVHLMLVALPFVTVAISSLAPTSSLDSHSSSDSHSPSATDPTETTPPISNSESRAKVSVPLKFGSQCNYWFNEYVNANEVPEWDEALAAGLVRNCEDLLQKFKEREEKRLSS
ncbi:ERG27 [Sanghuangporus weigelae]